MLTKKTLDSAREALTAASIKATAAWAEKHYRNKEKKTKKPAKTKKIKELEKFFSRNPFGCNHSDVRALVEILIERKLEPPKSGSTSLPEPERLVMIIPTDNRNSHNYGRSAAISLHGWHGMLKSHISARGNTMDARKDSSRPATPAEIKKSFSKMSKNCLMNHFKEDILEMILSGEIAIPTKKRAARAKK